ncbi:TonB-dependent receptor plug domain-containing protein [candidate division KSB1 bacterium]
MYNMTMKILLAVIVVYIGSYSEYAFGFQQKTKLTEESLFEQIETIITASKREQRIQDSPSTISVITEEDIKESGAATIPDLLRFVPGIDVMQVTSSHWEVNARGLNQLRSNKMLVMIDGRSVYFDYYGGVIWQGLPITLEDIKRIEVIRSPLSSLYGANAFSGIINIITKSPRESAGTHAIVEKGNLNSMRSSIIYGDRRGRLGYKLSGTYREISTWRNEDVNSEKRSLGNVKLDYLFSGKSSLTFDAGFESGNVEQVILATILRFEGNTHYAKANYNYGNLNLQFFWNHGDISSPSFVGYGANADSKYDTYDGELVHTLGLGDRNTVTLGGSARINKIKSNIIDKDHQQNLYAGFLQNEFMPNEKTAALIGVRVDNHPLVDNNVSPRASVVYSPKSNHTFRLTASKAFRNPAFTDSYLLVPLEPIALPSPPMPPGSTTDITIIGNEKLKPENIETFELGYQTFYKSSLKLKIDLFYNRIDDFIGTGDFIPQSFYTYPGTGEPIIDPASGLPIPMTMKQSFVNLGTAKTFGGECEWDWLVNMWLRLRGNYSYLDIENKYTLHKYSSPPVNKFNIISDISINENFSLSLLGHFIGKTKWDIDTDNDSIPEKHDIPSYFTLDSRLTLRIPESGISAELTAQNLLNKEHREYPVVGETIGRRIALRLIFKR